MFHLSCRNPTNGANSASAKVFKKHYDTSPIAYRQNSIGASRQPGAQKLSVYFRNISRKVLRLSN